MLGYLSFVFGHAWTWLADAVGALYAGMVLMRHRTDGPHYRLSFDPRHPARSVLDLAVWLGMKFLQACLWFGRAFLNMLLEASAEVGEWLMRRSPTVEESIRSRFLV